MVKADGHYEMEGWRGGRAGVVLGIGIGRVYRYMHGSATWPAAQINWIRKFVSENVLGDSSREKRDERSQERRARRKY